MPGVPADLHPQRIEPELQTRWLGRSLEVLGATASTNDDARSAAERGAPHGHVVVADRQERGRGTRGRVWSSPGGTDLYVSAVLRPTVRAASLPVLTLAVGLGVAEAAAQLSGVETGVKWPNDVWIGGRKCAGVLVETTTRGPDAEHVVVGIGFNVNRTTFEGDLGATATSVRLACAGALLSRTRALCALLGRVEAWTDRYLEDGPAPVVAALQPRLVLRGERVRCGDVMGRLLGLAPTGALRLRTADGDVREVISGDLQPVV